MTESRTYTLRPEGMHCGSCTARATRALSDVEGLSDVSVNLATESAGFTAPPDRVASAAEALEALEAVGYAPRESELMLSIEGMHCGSCVGRAERAISAVPGVRTVSVNLAGETARVAYLDGAADDGAERAAAAMAMSSIFVLGNALLLRRMGGAADERHADGANRGRSATPTAAPAE